MTVTRKLNQVRNSFYVYLPKDWCRQFQLNKDSEVRIEQTTEGILKITPLSVKSGNSKQLKFSYKLGSLPSVINHLVGAYIVGASRIQILFDAPLALETREDISRWIRKLPGFEILEEHESGFTVSDTSEKQVLIPILRRQFSTVKFMLNSLIDSISGVREHDLSRILDRDEDVDRHRYFVERLCHLALRNPSYAKKIQIDPSEALHFSLATKYVERIADHICGATSELIGLDEIPSDLMNQCYGVLEAFEITTHAFFSVRTAPRKNHDSLSDLSEESLNALDVSTKLSSNLAELQLRLRNRSPHKSLLLMHLERIASYCADIGEVAINRTLSSSL